MNRTAGARAACAVLMALAMSGTALGQGARPGDRFEVRAADLPAPYATDSVANRSQRVRDVEGLPLRVPEGFRVDEYAGGFEHARWLAVAPGGDVYLAQPRAGEVTLLRDSDGDGRADVARTVAEDFDRPHGLAVHDGALYVADLDAVWRLPLAADGPVSPDEAEQITADGALGSSRGHWTRNVTFDAAGERLFVSIGSAGNIAEEPQPRATIQVFAAAGGQGRTYAAGLRNPVGIVIHPDTGDLYTVVNERDGMGDELVPDYLTRVEDGDFYGWPYAYIGSNPQPDYAQRRPDLVERTKVPDVLFRSHSAPLGLAFYDGAQFPEDFRGDAFVALHGSWNAALPRGYMVVRVPFEGGQPLGWYEAFLTGFWVEGRDTAGVFGRPVGLAVAADGSLLVADDVAQKVWRVSYGE